MAVATTGLHEPPARVRGWFLMPRFARYAYSATGAGTLDGMTDPANPTPHPTSLEGTIAGHGGIGGSGSGGTAKLTRQEFTRRLVGDWRFIVATAVLVLSPVWMLPFLWLPLAVTVPVGVLVNGLAAWTGFRAVVEVHKYIITTG